MVSHRMVAPRRRGTLATLIVLIALIFAHRLSAEAPADVRVIRPDLPNEVAFPPTPARFVRLLIHTSSANQPCIDELEVYAPAADRNLALAQQGAQPSASSCLSGYAQHAIDHLNDGEYGNANSWIAAGEHDEWAQIELRDVTDISKVVFSRDRNGQYADRIPVDVEVQLSANGTDWQTVAHVAGRAAKIMTANGVPGYIPPPPPPPGSSGVRTAAGGNAELQLAARRQDEAGFTNLALPASAQPNATSRAMQDNDYQDLLRLSVLAEEHAWLKTYGHADLSSRLVPYNGRVKQYPHHASTDVLPLATLEESPHIDGRLDDTCWNLASRGVVRVAFPRDYEQGPLVETAVRAGYRDGDLFLAMETNQLLSSHLAVISRGDGEYAGVVLVAPEGLRWNRYAPDGQLSESVELEAAHDPSLRVFEVRLPLAWFPEYTTYGLRIGLGMGGQHTREAGNAVQFACAPLSIAEAGPCCDKIFRVRLTATHPEQAVRISGNAPALADGLNLTPGQSRVIEIRGDGPIGPEYGLVVHDDRGATYRLHLFRYAPLERTLTLMEAMLARFEQRGLDVSGEREELAGLRKRHAQLLAEPYQLAAERQTLYMRPLSFANLTEWGPSVMTDGRIIWQRSEYVDKGADFSHTLWAIRPDGTHPELVFGNDIIQPNGYANGREVPGTTEFLCTLISHFGDLNGPLALVDPCAWALQCRGHHHAHTGGAVAGNVAPRGVLPRRFSHLPRLLSLLTRSAGTIRTLPDRPLWQPGTAVPGPGDRQHVPDAVARAEDSAGAACRSRFAVRSW